MVRQPRGDLCSNFECPQLAARHHATPNGHLHFYRSELAVVTEPSSGSDCTLGCSLDPVTLRSSLIRG